MARTFGADEIDSVKRGLGVVKDLARSAAGFTAEILALHEQGIGICEIARRLNLHRKAVARTIHREK